ncbi:MAG: kinase inhibitor, partial [Bacilli bacterium]|nr:kinase inhibitor [Bacilli bacterium]
MVPLGDSAVIVKFGEQVDPETHQKVRVLSDYLEQHPVEGLVEYIPAFTSITVFYDLTRLVRQDSPQKNAQDDFDPYHSAVKVIEDILVHLNEAASDEPRLVE